MYPIPGHAAMSIVGARLLKLPYTPAIAATFFVDIADKFFSDVIYIAPYGRCWFHTLLSVAICSLLVAWWKGKAWGASWCVGHFLHLIGDIGFIPWFYPVIPYDWPPAPNVVEASIKGLEEAAQGFMFIRDASGNLRFAGWHFSEAVLYVFKGNLMLIEGMMLFCAGGVAFLQAQQKTKLFACALAVFLIITGFRLMYDFPGCFAIVNSLFSNGY